MSDDSVNSAEFSRWMNLIQDGIKGVHDRLDTLNGRTREVESDVAVLKAQSATAKDPAARWTAVGSAIGAAIAGVGAWFK